MGHPLLAAALLAATPLASGDAAGAGDAAPPPTPATLRPDRFEGPVFVERDGYVVAEAESAVVSARWELRNDPAQPGGCEKSLKDARPEAPTGKGYLRWNGPILSCAAQGKPEIKEDLGEKHGDLTQGCQGDPRDWLVVKLWVSRPGTYQVDLRSYHLREDGDNDAWIGHVGQKGTINRQTNCRTRTYSWGNYTRPVKLARGLNAVYVAGRSHGFGVDRIAIFQESRAKVARDPSTPESPRRPVRQGRR